MAVWFGYYHYLAISLASFSMDDPAWSRSVPKSHDVANLGGLFGSYLSDVGYYLFGLSFWWWIVASCVFLYKNFRPMKKAGKPQALQSRRSCFGIIPPAGVQPDYRTFLV